MPAVEVLPDELVNQIAAGEVVERPASVVKELVENALDAGATRVDVAIRGGGIRWIEVTDDGSGMDAGDAVRAFQRHATSKIATAGDLERVRTLGFRGEALPSIAAVGRVRMRTRPRGAELGTELSGEGDGIAEPREVACPEGTRVEVAELFARVPARRKFLKTPVTEGTHIVRWLERVGLARPDVRFALERDGRSVLLLLPTIDPRERAIGVLPPSIGERLLAIEGEIPTARLRGFASPTDVLRGTTGDIHLLVNARPVRDRLLLHAVRQAYQDALPPGRHPVAVLYLNVEPDAVDVNVHPAKSEVRFRDPGAIRSLVSDSLVRALGLPARAPAGASYRSAAPWAPAVRETAPPPDLALLGPRSAAGPSRLAGATAGVERPRGNLATHRYVGQLLGTYLVLEGPATLVLLDQHAAHERLLFERMRASLLGGKLERQALLLPSWVELPRSAADALAGAESDLERAGFEIEVAEGGVRGGARVGIRAVPAALAASGRGGSGRTDWEALLTETAAALRDAAAADAAEGREGIDAALHGILATAACHTAVRKGDRLDAREVEALLEGLDAGVWFPNCPHGRPILWTIDEAELERRFLRR